LGWREILFARLELDWFIDGLLTQPNTIKAPAIDP
jgi:hypothetical protein